MNLYTELNTLTAAGKAKQHEADLKLRDVLIEKLTKEARKIASQGGNRLLYIHPVVGEEEVVRMVAEELRNQGLVVDFSFTTANTQLKLNQDCRKPKIVAVW